MLSVRKTISKLDGEVQKHEGIIHQIIHLLLPPFVIYLTTWAWNHIQNISKRLWGIIW